MVGHVVKIRGWNHHQETHRKRRQKVRVIRPNLFARSLRSWRSHTVGVMVFDAIIFCTLVRRGIQTC